MLPSVASASFATMNDLRIGRSTRTESAWPRLNIPHRRLGCAIRHVSYGISRLSVQVREYPADVHGGLLFSGPRTDRSDDLAATSAIFPRYFWPQPRARV